MSGSWLMSVTDNTSCFIISNYWLTVLGNHQQWFTAALVCRWMAQTLKTGLEDVSISMGDTPNHPKSVLSHFFCRDQYKCCVEIIDKCKKNRRGERTNLEIRCGRTHVANTQPCLLVAILRCQLLSTIIKHCRPTMAINQYSITMTIDSMINRW